MRRPLQLDGGGADTGSRRRLGEIALDKGLESPYSPVRLRFRRFDALSGAARTQALRRSFFWTCGPIERVASPRRHA